MIGICCWVPPWRRVGGYKGVVTGGLWTGGVCTGGLWIGVCDGKEPVRGSPALGGGEA